MISSWIRSHLPGPAVVKALLVIVTLAAATAALFELVFPWLAPMLPIQEQTVE